MATSYCSSIRGTLFAQKNLDGFDRIRARCLLVKAASDLMSIQFTQRLRDRWSEREHTQPVTKPAVVCRYGLYKQST